MAIDDRIAAVTALLHEAEAAHGTYETTELNGVYDQEWPRWYAAFAVEHGIGEVVGRAITSGPLAQFLADSYGDFQRAEPQPGEGWAAYAARRITAELGED
jgi:hypothetical protein